MKSSYPMFSNGKCLAVKLPFNQTSYYWTLRTLLTALMLFALGMVLHAQPAVSYSSPPTYTVSTTITPLAPTSSGVASPGFSTAPVTLPPALNEALYGIAVDG